MDPIITVGAPAPSFELPDLYGVRHSLKDMLGQIVVLNFWSAECSWCERVDQELSAYQKSWAGLVVVWWIASNANEPHQLIEKMAVERQLSTVLLDEDQSVASLYGALTTPHFFVVNGDGKLAYQGAWDDITFRKREASKVYVPEVIEALKKNVSVEVTQTPPYGCVLVRFGAAKN